MSAPQRYVEWINKNLGFNPRSQTNSNALSTFIVEDLRAASASLDSLISSDQISALINASVATSVAIRNVDLVLYEKHSLPKLSVSLSVEHKTVMTSHGKARLNRYGDIISYCNHMHNHRRNSVVGATIVINTSALYKNPDAFAQGLIRPKFNMDKVVQDTVKVFTGIPLRESPEDPNDQPEALTVLVVDYDGVNPATLVKSQPAPTPDMTAHYDSFITRLAKKFEDRFCQ
ncbi:MAG: hypothetical protein ACR2LM_19665 [Pyrinomonadaceae bacterium]